MSFSQILYGQHFHPSAVVIAYITEKIQSSKQEHDRATFFLNNLASLEAQAFFASSILRLNSGDENETNHHQQQHQHHLSLKLNQDYTSSVAKTYVKWIESVTKILQAEKDDDDDIDDRENNERLLELEFDDDLMNLTATSTFCSIDNNNNNLPLAKNNHDDDDDDDAHDKDDNEAHFKTLTFFDSFGNKVYAKVGPQFENVGLSLWPASSLLSKFVVDYVSENLVCATAATKEKNKNNNYDNVQRDDTITDANNNNNNNNNNNSNNNNRESPFAMNSSPVVFIELGTGIGLSGVLFQKAVHEHQNNNNQEETNRHSFRFIMTDYQDVIVDLGRKNLALNPPSGGRLKKENKMNEINNDSIDVNSLMPPSPCSEYRYLHWGEQEQNVNFFNNILREQRQLEHQQNSIVAKNLTPTKDSNINSKYFIVAADVIYNPDCIPDLVRTIQTAFTIFPKNQLQVIIFHTVRNPATFEMFTKLMTTTATKNTSVEQKFKVEIFDAVNNNNFDSVLNSQLDSLISVLSTTDENDRKNNNNPHTDDNNLWLKPLIDVNPAQKENILRSLQGGRFYNGIFAKMANQLRRVVISLDES